MVIDRFPYGRAPFWLAVLALSTIVLLLFAQRESEAKPDLVFAIHAPNHVESYSELIPRFEAKHGVKVRLQLVNNRALETRLQNAMLAGTPVPDIVELSEKGLGYFTRGPLKDVGFLDLTDRLDGEGYRERLVESRLSLWTSRGRTFALPHDVHPVSLMYRPDLVERLGIDVKRLVTWDDFVEAGQRMVRQSATNGVVKHYMIDLPNSAPWGLLMLMLQRGIGLFDAGGNIAFNGPATVDTIEWYIHQTAGPNRIAFECGWGQPLFKAMLDGLALFYIAPDWRTNAVALDAPHLKGKFRLMPLPAWEPGGRRTSVWGGTGLAIARSTAKPELAWEFAKALYFDTRELGRRYAMTNILPPFKDAWNLPELKQPEEFYGGQRIGELFAELAPETPAVWSGPYWRLAEFKLSEAHLSSLEYFRTHGDRGLREHIQKELDMAEAYVKRSMARNVLMKK
jgi:arabinosaccharide transport system substrate-binding protein